MAMKISDIPPEGLIAELDEKIDLFAEEGAAAPFTARFRITPAGNGVFHVTGTVSAEAELECSRCLRRFHFPVRNAAMEFDLVPELRGNTPAEHELGRGELETEFYRGDEIEPKDFIREQILLALPMVPVHRPDCKGLCPVCGTDRNERECGCKRDEPAEKENPFAVLKKIIKPEKE